MQVTTTPQGGCWHGWTWSPGLQTFTIRSGMVEHPRPSTRALQLKGGGALEGGEEAHAWGAKGWPWGALGEGRGVTVILLDGRIPLIE